LKLNLYIIKLFFLIILHSINALKANDITLQPEITTSSFIFPLDVKINNNWIQIQNRLALFHTAHPSNRHMLYSYQRKNVSLVAEISNLILKKGGATLLIGRDYIKSGPVVYNSPLFSRRSPSLDQIAFKWDSIPHFNFEYYLIQLDNRRYDELTFNRWLYARRIGIMVTQKIEFGFKDAVLATGVKRGVNLNYLNPGSIFQLEQLHGNTGALDGNPTTNNDNQLIGFDCHISIRDSMGLYFDLLIDEFQVDREDRKYFQDIFAFTIGLMIRANSNNYFVEYFYSSPWMYLNGGVFTNYEVQNHPLGLPGPLTHGISFSWDGEVDIYKASILITLSQNDHQNFYTDYEPAYNHINYWTFSNNPSFECYGKLYINKNKYIEHLGVSYNLLASNTFHFLIGFNIPNLD
jgi:hypothetical protein